MPVSQTTKQPKAPWTPIPDPADRFSTGIRDFDRLLGGGFSRGSMALFRLDSTLEPGDWEVLFTPTLLNFLYQSNGVMAVLPSRESPHEFRTHLTRWVSRRRFDTRVRVIDYVGQDSGAPYVVNLSAKTEWKGPAKAQTADKAKEFRKMEAAEAAIQGARSRMFLEMVAFETAEVLFGPQTAGR